MALTSSVNNDEFVFNYDEKLIIELHDSSIFDGDYSGGSDNRIDIYNVLVYPKEYPQSSDFITFHDVVSLYRHEIASIRRFKTKTCQNNSKNQQIIPMIYDDFHDILHYASKYTYLNHVDAKYSRTILHLRDRDSIGVVGLGMETKATIPINYVVISTSTDIFIFDLFSIDKQHFPRELKDLLESKTLQKVMHKSSIFVDHLRKCYKVVMENIFDTAVADLLIQKHKTGVTLDSWRSLSECLSDYYNFPHSLVEDERSTIKWQDQPLRESHRRRAALLVGYLLMLRDKFEGIMLKSYYDGVESYSSALLKNDKM